MRLLGLALVLCIYASVSIGSVFAQTPDTLATLYSCQDIPDSEARLACYDQQVADLREAENAGDFVAIDRKAAKEIEKDAFGLKIPSLPKLKIFQGSDEEGESSKRQSFAIKKVSKRKNGYLQFELENGQIWIQTQAPTFRFRSKNNPDVLVIKKAALGSFLARVNGKGRSFRVKRVE